MIHIHTRHNADTSLVTMEFKEFEEAEHLPGIAINIAFN